MKILFTKTGIEKEVAEQLEDRLRFDFVDVIRIQHLEVLPFDLEGFSLIFTSQNAVKAFVENSFVVAKEQKIYAVGEKTRAALSQQGFTVVKTTRNVEELSVFLIETANQEKFIHFCGDLTLDVLENDLKAKGRTYQKAVVYTTQLLETALNEAYDAVVFFSPSGVRSLAVNNTLEGKKVFCIGKTTEKEIEKYFTGQIFTSKENSLEEVLKIIKREADLNRKL